MNRPAIEVREARARDLPGLLSIYNEAIGTTTAVFTEVPETLAQRRQWWLKKRASGCPVLVAADGEDVLGFGSYGDFRTWSCYRFTVEHGLYVRADVRRTGVGTLLVQALEQSARDAGKHAIMAGIEAENHASIRLHPRLGFSKVGYLREVGWKFDRWLDLLLLQRLLF